MIDLKSDCCGMTRPIKSLREGILIIKIHINADKVMLRYYEEMAEKEYLVPEWKQLAGVTKRRLTWHRKNLESHYLAIRILEEE